MKEQTFELPALRVPLPAPTGQHQSGITDPLWPVETPPGVDEADYADYRGRVAKQNFCSVIAADVTRGAELEPTLRELSDFIRGQLDRKPSEAHMRPLDRVPASYRVTITVGFGASLFLTRDGDDRFGLSGQRPRWLRAMPSFFGDAEEFRPTDSESDLLLSVSSDHPYVNAAIVRDLAAGRVRGLEVARVETGFHRPDQREFLRFDDGIDNLRNLPGSSDLDDHVYVSEGDDEPAWCVGGSYMVYRKIREKLRDWDGRSDKEQSRMIGRVKATGEPLSTKKTGPQNMTPVFEGDTKTPLTAHIRKVQPRRQGLDFMGCDDLTRRFLRRPYPFFDGVDDEGQVVVGLHFLAFMKSLRDQFEWVTEMWQTNPDFPEPNTGRDALFEHGILKTVEGGYFFCPPAPKNANDYIGSGLFHAGTSASK